MEKLKNKKDDGFKTRDHYKEVEELGILFSYFPFMARCCSWEKSEFVDFLTLLLMMFSYFIEWLYSYFNSQIRIGTKRLQQVSIRENWCNSISFSPSRSCIIQLVEQEAKNTIQNCCWIKRETKESGEKKEEKSMDSLLK